MGGERETTTTTQTTTPTQTAEERRLNQLSIERIEAVQPGQISAQQAGLSLVTQLLGGQEPLPGFFEQLSAGISPEITSEIVQESLRDITPQFQAAGILDSGVAASIAARTAGDIRRSVQEFNIGSKFNLLNLALSGQAQVQQPLLAQSQILGARLAGLRTITTAGQQTITRQGPNPFLTAGLTAAGTAFGGPIGGAIGGGLAGFLG